MPGAVYIMCVNISHLRNYAEAALCLGPVQTGHLTVPLQCIFKVKVCAATLIIQRVEHGAGNVAKWEFNECWLHTDRSPERHRTVAPMWMWLLCCTLTAWLETHCNGKQTSSNRKTDGFYTCFTFTVRPLRQSARSPAAARSLRREGVIYKK